MVTTGKLKPTFILTFRLWQIMDSHSTQGHADLKLVVIFYGTTEWEMFRCSSCDHQGIIEQEQAIHRKMLIYSETKRILRP